MNSFVEIANLIRTDLGGRGLGQVILEDDFNKAVEELHASSSVVIVTGFCIKDGMIGETDGPLGAISLAYALEQLGKKVVLVTDEYSDKLLSVCLGIKKIKSSIEIIPYDGADEFCKEIIIKHEPSHIVSIERPGKAVDGRYYNMRGEDLTHIIPSADKLFELAKEMNITTIAVGDGGNELGMGKIASYIKKLVNKGNQICAVTVADYLIVAGVSNWGGLGLTAGLSLISQKDLLHDKHIETKLLKAIVNEGAIDGCSKKQELTVDGLSLEVNLDILEKLISIVEKGNSCSIKKVL